MGDVCQKLYVADRHCQVRASAQKLEMVLTDFGRLGHGYWTRNGSRILGRGVWFGGDVERSALCLSLTHRVGGGVASTSLPRVRREVADARATWHTAATEMRVCRAVRIAITADGNTTALFRHAQIAEGAVRIAIFALKNIRKAENVANANILAAGVRNMCR